MAGIPLSDDACERLVASRDPVDADRLRDEAVLGVSRRLRDELITELVGEPLASEAAARRRHRPGLTVRRQRAAAVVAIAAVVVVGVLSLVGSWPLGGGHNGPLEVPDASAAVVLDRAARAAMRGTSVVPGNGRYGFVEVKTGSVIGPREGHGEASWSAWVRVSETKSDWYAADGSGRERIVRTASSFLTYHDRTIATAHGSTLAQLTAATAPRDIDGAFPPRTLQTAGFLPYWQMTRLPTRPVALRRALDRLLLVSSGRAKRSFVRQMRADPAGLFAPISQFLFLPTSPKLRAAMFRVLAALPGVQLLGHQRDRLGRSGIAVAVTQGRPNRVREELLFDPATSNVLQTQTVQLRASKPSLSRSGLGFPGVPAGTVWQFTDFLSRGVVTSITQLPGGQHLPLTHAGRNR